MAKKTTAGKKNQRQQATVEVNITNTVRVQVNVMRICARMGYTVCTACEGCCKADRKASTR